MHKARTFILGCAVVLLPSLTASSAGAAGIALSWGNYCWGEEGVRANLTWACDSNTNDDIRMTCTFKLDEAMPDFVGIGVYMEGMTAAAAVPDWWKLGEAASGDCRAGLISMSADGSVLPYGGTDVCFDPWQGLGSGGIGLYSWDGNRMHVDATWALPEAIPLEAATEYFAVQFRVSAERTVGTCTGCSVPAVWVMARMDVQTTTATLTLDRPYMGGWRCLNWQSPWLPCPNDTPDPARADSWGLIKSLYR